MNKDRRTFLATIAGGLLAAPLAISLLGAPVAAADDSKPGPHSSMAAMSH